MEQSRYTSRLGGWALAMAVLQSGSWGAGEAAPSSLQKMNILSTEAEVPSFLQGPICPTIQRSCRFLTCQAGVNELHLSIQLRLQVQAGLHLSSRHTQPKSLPHLGQLWEFVTPVYWPELLILVVQVKPVFPVQYCMAQAKPGHHRSVAT